MRDFLTGTLTVPRPHFENCCAVIWWVGMSSEQTGPFGPLGGAAESAFLYNSQVSLGVSWLQDPLLGGAGSQRWGERKAECHREAPECSASLQPRGSDGKEGAGMRSHSTSQLCSLIHSSWCVPAKSKIALNMFPDSESLAVSRPHSVYYLTQQFGSSSHHPIFLLCHPQ